MKRILITGGPTNEAIDEVMKITNMSTGKLSLSLAKKALDMGDEVCLIINESVARSDYFERFGLAKAENLKIVTVETTEDMLEALDAEHQLVEGQAPYDVVIHASAVGDYKPQFSFRMEDMAKELACAVSEMGSCGLEEMEARILTILTDPDCKVDDNTKISSYEPHLTVKLTLTTKLIARLRAWYPNATLIGFKLLENVTKEHLVEVAQKLCVKNEMDYIMANDLAELRKGYSTRYMVNREGFTGVTFNAPDSIYDLGDYAAEHWF